MWEVMKRQFCNKSGVRLLAAQKANKETRLVERKVFFILNAGNHREGELLSKGWLPHNWQSVGKRIHWQEGVTGKDSTVSFDSHLKIGYVVLWPASVDCFRYSSSSVLGLVCSHFSVVSSWNCGSLYHGYSLQSTHRVVNFFSLVGVSVSIRQLTGYGSEYDLQPMKRNYIII